MTKLEKALKARSLINECGDYDSAIAGAVGEIYAEEVLGMVKAGRGERGYDGKIGGREVQVKSKEPFTKKESVYYVGISHKNTGKAKDLVVVLLGKEGVEGHYGPVPLEQLESIASTRKNQVRYFISKIRTICAFVKYV
jgi:hypothetical protein